tara:strand:- start:7779 stop:8114 length:336 start_codon:yes stop_codon:yes gene_type:complete
MFQCPYSSCGAIFDDSGIRNNLMRFQQGQCPRCAKEISVDFDLSEYGSTPVPKVIEEILEDIPESEVVSETIETEEDWENCTVSELKKALKKRGLSTKGKKTTLLKRLEKE